jgi:hypothetical protein
MTDTPQHIKELQLKIWLAKSPAERLLQYLKDNDTLYKGILQVKNNITKVPEKLPANNND